jgi:hypothetical protein
LKTGAPLPLDVSIIECGGAPVVNPSLCQEHGPTVGKLPTTGHRE